MKKLALFVMVFILLFSLNAIAAVDISGAITTQTWTKANSPYRIIGLSNVAVGNTLTIQPGVTVAFTGAFRIVVNGTITAIGLPSDSIIFKHETAGQRHLRIRIENATVPSTFEYCRFQDGSGYGDDTRGGALYVYNSSPVIRHCTFYNNIARWGGAIFITRNNTSTIESCIFDQNRAGLLGGAVACEGYDSTFVNKPSFINNIFVANIDSSYGAGALGFYNWVHGSVMNCVFYNNTSISGNGGAIDLRTNRNLIAISNSVFWGNTAGGTGTQIHLTTQDTVNIDYSDVQGADAGIVGTGLINYGSHNLNSSPLFNNPTGNDFQFEANSPLLDVGTSTAAPATDFYGNARPFDGDRDNNAEYDIGAYEYQNTTPQITSTAVLTATEEVAYSYQVVATDPDYGDDLTYSLTTAPAFLSINSGTGLISGTPGNGDVGSHAVTVRVADLNNAAATQPYTLAVANVNDPPVVADIPNQTINEGSNFTTINLDSYVNDIDNTDVQIIWTYSGNTNLTVSIVSRVATISTPNANWFGNETITFTATDPGLLTDNDAAAFIVRSVNDAPVAVNDAVTTNEDTPVVIDVLDNDSDVDGTLTVSTVTPTDPPHGSTTVNSLTGVITYSPDANYYGSDSFTYTVRDDSNAVSNAATVNVTINGVNDLPVVTDIPGQSVAEGSSFTTITLDNYVSDVETADADIVWTYGGDTDLTVSIVSRVATISTPNADWNGSETITFYATDQGGSADNDAATFTVTAVNDAPVVSDIPNQSVTEGNSFTTINLDTYVSDADNPDADIVWTYSGNTDLSVSIVNRVATVTAPSGEWNGSETITFRAEDPSTLYDNDAATFTVTGVSDAPVVSDIPNQSISEGSSFTTINLDNYVSDVDNSDAEMTWTYSGNTDLSVSIVNRVATVTAPSGDWNGSETITFRATDPDALYDSDEATFTVTAVNDAPVVENIPDQSVAEGSNFVTIALDNYVSDADNSDTQLTWTYSGNTDLTVSIVSRVATISIPAANWYGSETITFRAEDPSTLYDSDAATFTVRSVNDTPVAVNDTGITDEDTAVEISVLANDTDIDGILVLSSVTVGSGPAHGNTSVNTTTGVITYTPVSNYNGGDSFTYTVQDDSNAVSNAATVTITVDLVNDPPVISTLPELSFNEDDSLLYTFAELYDNVTDADTPDSLLIPAIILGQDLTVRVAADMLVFKAAANWFGKDTLSVVVADGQLADTAEIHVSVHSINDLPVLVNLPDTVKFNNEEDKVLVMSAYVEDADLPNDNINWQFTASNEILQLQFNAPTSELTLSAPVFTGIISLRFTVTDDSGATAVDSVVINVVAGPSGILPDLTLIPRQHELYQNYPNPFNPLTRIRFGLPFAGRVRLEIYNILGQRVGVLLDEVKQPGYHIVEFNAAALTSGIYFYRLQTERYNKVMKMILLK